MAIDLGSTVNSFMFALISAALSFWRRILICDWLSLRLQMVNFFYQPSLLSINNVPEVSLGSKTLILLASISNESTRTHVDDMPTR
jgi:hypothetical protein